MNLVTLNGFVDVGIDAKTRQAKMMPLTSIPGNHVDVVAEIDLVIGI
jgi:uncharacterized protein YcgI (DUF1989 family)